MNRDRLIELAQQARKRADSGDGDIATQHEIVSALEREGLESDKAREVLAKLITAQDVDLTEMERLLDELDRG